MSAVKRIPLLVILLISMSISAGVSQSPVNTTNVKLTQWPEAMLAAFGRSPVKAAKDSFGGDFVRFKIIEEWLAQDGVGSDSELTADSVKKPISELGADGNDMLARFNELQQASVDCSDRKWAELYLTACERRRAARLGPHMDIFKRLVFTRHFDMGGSHYAYTEALSDTDSERNIAFGSSLCLLDIDGIYGKVTALLDDPNGVIRDPDVSYDGKRILFSWKKSMNEDDYHLHEMTLADGKTKELNHELGFADYEGAYLPNGDIVFNSTRCVTSVDCWWTEVSNLYTCAGDGKYLRRLSFDQVHTNYPTVTSDGRVIYTRWDYNDRGQIFPQGLFQMFPDGTAQAAFYGNNSWFPTSILHARGIPGTGKVVCIFSGHHSRQRGWLAILDPSKGREENSGAQLICPVRETRAEHIDSYGQSGDQFQYPYPLSETEFIVAYRREDQPHFMIAWVDQDGRREILAADPNISCNQPVPLRPRPVPHERPSSVDYRRNTGVCYIQDIYAGPGLKDIPRGTIKRLRIVAVEWKAAAVGSNGNSGPAGGALVSTPISISGGCWDIKKVLGTTKIYDDGSAAFVVPARTPIYFQPLNEKGQAVQTMRSWATLQPGEVQSCVGCHEDKNSAPPSAKATLAMKAGPHTLMPFYGEPRGFSFAKEIQPILDRNCVKCHNGEPGSPFGLTGKTTRDNGAQRNWSESYLKLADRKYCNWVNVQSAPPMLEPYSAGAAKSRLIKMLEKGHNKVQLSKEEMDKLCTWIDLLVPYCGDYFDGLEGNSLTKYQRFSNKRKQQEALEARNIADLIRMKYEKPAKNK